MEELMQTILVCDDDKEIVEAIEIYLQQEGYHILKAYDGEEALEILKENEVHLLIMDVMMPRLDGIRATLKIREESSIPIIILSAKTEDADKILGLNIGADDYVTKPFSNRELQARVKALLRRSEFAADPQLENEADTEIVIGDLHILPDAFLVQKANKELDLTHREFELLYHLATHVGQVMTREHLLETVWGYDYFGDVRTVDVTVRRLREKIEDTPGRPEYILTRRGVGYYMRNND